MNNAELEAKVMARASSRSEAKEFIKAVRRWFKDDEVNDMKPGVVYSTKGIYAYSSYTATFYKLDVNL